MKVLKQYLDNIIGYGQRPIVPIVPSNDCRVKTTLDILEDYVRRMEQKVEYIEPKRSLTIQKPKPFVL